MAEMPEMESEEVREDSGFDYLVICIPYLLKTTRSGDFIAEGMGRVGRVGICVGAANAWMHVVYVNSVSSGAGGSL